jgi:hypothetical protein
MKLIFYCVVLWLAGLIQAQHCRIAGQIFFADVVDHAITLKTDSGDLVNLSYDGATSFLLAGSGSQPDVGATRVPPEQLNNGDRLCVGTSEPLVVTVTPRRDIETRQKKELAAWQTDSLYGVVSELDRNARRITLAVSAGDKDIGYSVDVSPDAAYWVFPRNTIRLSDAVTGSLDQVAPGDTLYVRGTKDRESQKFAANLIVSGGFRSFAATIETIKPLDELLDVHLVLSGNRRTVHISPGELFAIGQAGPAGKDRRLYRIAAADLHPGDTVLILGINEGQDSLSACALIAGFSPFGVLPPDSSQLMRWIFDNLSPGDPYSMPGSPAPR